VDKYWYKQQVDAKEAYLKPGARDILNDTPPELQKWRDAAMQVDARWAKGAAKTGQDPKQVVDSLHEELTKVGGAL
jgi:hypothetical protein